ncbi:MAG: hypothetical protein AAGI07_20145 [Bacteroidota bacterium]
MSITQPEIIYHSLCNSLGVTLAEEILPKEIPLIPCLLFAMYVFIMLPLSLFPSKETPEINKEDEFLKSLIENSQFEKLDDETETSTKKYKNKSALYDAYITIIRKKKLIKKKRGTLW